MKLRTAALTLIAGGALVYRRMLRERILTWGATPAEAAARLPGWIENLLGLNMHSVDRVLPDYQHPQIGEGFGYGANRMSFAIVEPEHVLSTRSAEATGCGHDPDGAGLAGDGAEDAAGDQRARGRARGGAAGRQPPLTAGAWQCHAVFGVSTRHALRMQQRRFSHLRDAGSTDPASFRSGDAA